jgi:hypothetical protein
MRRTMIGCLVSLALGLRAAPWLADAQHVVFLYLRERIPADHAGR